MPSTGADPPGRATDARPPVFLCDADAMAGDVVVLDGPEGRHAATVRRLAAGERVDLTDGSGHLAECVVADASGGRLRLTVVARRAEAHPDPALSVAQALPKGDRGALAVELLTEAGVDEIVPWAAERCVTRWPGERADRGLERWRVTAREAAKQARRAWLPQVSAVEATPGLLRRVAGATLAVLLDPAAPIGLAEVALPRTGRILLVVGPEGGVSPQETGDLTGAGAVGARLGPTMLRTSTAGVVAAAVILSRSGRWRVSAAQHSPAQHGP